MLILKFVLYLAAAFVAVLLVFYLVSWIFLGIVSLTIDTKKTYDKPSEFYRILLNFGYRLICSHGRVHIESSGIDQIPENKKFMFVSNHCSKFDNMVESIVLHDYPLSFVSKKENFKIPIGHRFITRGCYISLDRGNPKSALNAILRASELIKNRKCSVGIYPEGTRSPDGNLMEFKPGCFKIAQKAKCPIVVGVLRNTFDIHKNFPWKSTMVYFDVIKVIQPEEIEGLKTPEISELVRGIILKEQKK